MRFRIRAGAQFPVSASLWNSPRLPIIPLFGCVELTLATNLTWGGGHGGATRLCAMLWDTDTDG